MNNVVENDKYLRSDNKSNNILISKINKLYQIDNIIINTSGLNANSFILEIIKIFYSNKINIFYSKDLYFENINLINYFSKINNIKIYEYINNNYQLINLLNNYSNEINILFIESCSNPYGHIFNFNIINYLKKINPFLIIICDNTWLSNQIFNPFNVNIDIVTISLTKYYSGNAGILGACIMKDNNLFKCAEEYRKMNGIHISPSHLDNIINALNFYDIRIKKLSYLTKFTIDLLLSMNIEIIHPYLKNHISYDLAFKYFNMNIYPSTFLIETKNSDNNFKFVSVSFGSNETKIDKKIFYNNNKKYIRLSIGYDENLESLKIKIIDLYNYYLKNI